MQFLYIKVIFLFCFTSVKSKLNETKSTTAIYYINNNNSKINTTADYRELERLDSSAETEAVWQKYLAENYEIYDGVTDKPLPVVKNHADGKITSAEIEAYRQIHLEENQEKEINVTQAPMRIKNSTAHAHFYVTRIEDLPLEKELKSTVTQSSLPSTQEGVVKISRRQYDFNDKKTIEKMKRDMMKPAEEDLSREENFRDPYYKGGDKVFLRTGSPTTPHEWTKYWNYYSTSFNPMAAHRDCDRSCSHYYKLYGNICGHRYNTKKWRNEYKNFNNMCDLDHANCVERHKRPYWHPLHKRDCEELNTFQLYPKHIWPVMGQKKYWHSFVGRFGFRKAIGVTSKRITQPRLKL